MARTIGRPRSQASSSGLGTRHDILAAAARVFTQAGYGAASTHRIAREARISQPTLYHYYAGKAELLLELLLATVRPSVAFAAAQRDADAPPADRLAALCVYDVTLLLADEHNIASLYLIPELADPRFEEFQAERTTLYRGYRELVADVLGVPAGEAHGRASLIFGLVESVILRRRTEPGLPGTPVAVEVADAALTVLGVAEPARAAAIAVGQTVAGDALHAQDAASVNTIGT